MLKVAKSKQTKQPSVAIMQMYTWLIFPHATRQTATIKSFMNTQNMH